MLHKTYISKMNSIVYGSNINTGLNPIGEITYGRNTTRLLCYFDHSEIKHMIEDGTMPNKDKMRHILKITNAGSLDFSELHSKYQSSIDGDVKMRATSFDLIFFLIPKEWDGGKGFDYSTNYLSHSFYNKKSDGFGERLTSTDGCNWFNARNGIKWDEEGVYSNETLSLEYDKFSSEVGSNIIIGRQRFDVGNENIEIDITETVNKFVSNELKNYGIGISFTPALERLREAKNSLISDSEQYVGFFTNHTNTFFEPYVETIYDDYISDDRSNFVLNKKNRLYLYCNIGGKPTNLDKCPIVKITDGEENDVIETIESKNQFKGVYYIDLSMSSKEYEKDTMYYDVWTDIVYQGEEIDDVELDFTLKDPHNWFNIDNTVHDEPDYTPFISGINDNEDIFREGEVRKVTVTARPSFTQNVGTLINEMFYRVYTMDGEREITVIPYEHVNMSFNENFFYINCDMLIPQKYYIDIRFKYNGETKTFKDVCHFKVVNHLNNKFA